MKYFNSAIFVLFTFVASAQITWYPVNSGVQTQLNCISFGSDLVGYIGGNDSTLLKTMDGGKTWNRIALTAAANTNVNDIVAMDFVDATHGYIIIGPYGDAFSTSDGSQTWSIENDLNKWNMCFKRSLYFLDFDNGFAGGSMCFQGETIANKKNGVWDTALAIGGWDAGNQITGFDFRDSLFGLASSTGRYIFRTTDGGANWDSIPTPMDTVKYTDVIFINDTLAYATYSKIGLEGAIVSYDGGLSWARDLTLTTFAYPGFDAALSVNGKPFFGGRVSWGNGGAIYSLGNSWWNYSFVPQRIHSLDMHSDSTVFAVGDSGFIAVNVLPSSIEVDEKELQEITVYPNPFSDKISIFGLRGESTLRVFDVNGKLLKSAILMQSEESIFVDDLPKGMYFFEFQNSAETRTVKLLK